MLLVTVRSIHADGPAMLDSRLIREHSATLLGSSQFARSSRLQRFLQFVVERELTGRDEIQEYTIGLEVFDRRKSMNRGERGGTRALFSTAYDYRRSPKDCRFPGKKGTKLGDQSELIPQVPVSSYARRGRCYPSGGTSSEISRSIHAFSKLPVAHDGLRAYLQNLRRLFHAQSSKKA